MQIDLSLNRVYWEYLQNKSYLRPEFDYQCSAFLPSMGCRVIVPEYKRRGKSFKQDLDLLVAMFAKKYSDYKLSHEKNGFEEPIFSFVPSIGITQIIKNAKSILYLIK